LGRADDVKRRDALAARVGDRHRSQMPAKKTGKPSTKKSPSDKRRAAEVEKAFGKNVRRAAERSGRKPAVWQESERPESRDAIRRRMESAAAAGAAAGAPAAAVLEVAAARTIDASASDVFRAFNDPTRRQWLGASTYQVRRAVAPRLLRLAMPDGSLVEVIIDRKGNTRCAVSLQHRQLADAAAAERAKLLWRDALARLADMLWE